jgi:chromosome segregation ATPase
MTTAWLKELRRDLKRYKDTAIDPFFVHVSADRQARYRYLVEQIGFESRVPEITEAYAIACCETAFLDDLHTKSTPKFGGALEKKGSFGIFSSNSQLYTILAKARKAYQSDKLSQAHQLQRIQSSLDGYQAEVNSLQQELAQATAKLEASKRREVDLTGRLVSSFELLANLQSTPINTTPVFTKTSDIRQLEQQYANKEKALKRTISENEDEFQRQLKVLKSEITAKNHDLEQQESINNYLQQELDKAKEKVEVLTQELTRLQTQLADVSKKDSVQSFDQLQKELEHTKAEMSQLQTEMASIISQHNADQEMISTQRETIRSLQERQYKMHDENVHLTLQNRDLHANPIIRTVKHTKQTLAAIEAAKDENKKLAKRVEEMTTEVTESKKIEAQLADQLEKTKQELAETRSALAKSRTFSQAQEEVLSANNSTILRYQTQVEDQQNTISRLESENSKIKSDFKTKVALLVTKFFRFFFSQYAVTEVRAKKDGSTVDFRNPDSVKSIAEAFSNSLVASAPQKKQPSSTNGSNNGGQASAKPADSNGATTAAMLAKNSSVFSSATNNGKAPARPVASTPADTDKVGGIEPAKSM